MRRSIIVPAVLALVVIVCISATIPLMISDSHKHHHQRSATVPGSETPASHWTPGRPDPYVCEYLGENDCWRPKYQSDGTPYMHSGEWPARSKKCVVEAGGDPQGDDTAAILKAFDDCKTDGHIVFENTTYYVGKVMNTTGLKDVDVELKGTLSWSEDIDYWLNNSLPIGFQNQTAAWVFGGDRIHFYGHGYGTLHGNGQVWYAYGKGESNIQGRPHAISFTGTTESVIEGLRFIKAQMWTMTVARSERVLLQDIYVNNSKIAGADFRSNVNTDGCDTLYADSISFLRWTVDCGDDAIALKQNSTNIYIANSTFVNGPGMAVGSIGQYPGQIEVVENVTMENIVCKNTGFCGRIKTWTGENTGWLPNGGGGGLGHAKNITFRNLKLHDVGSAYGMTQCTSYNGHKGGCDTSSFQISDIHWINATGTISSPNIATLQCSGNAPCQNIELKDNDMTIKSTGEKAKEYRCDNVDAVGFKCTEKCDGTKHCSH